MAEVYKDLAVTITDITDEGIVEAYVNTFGVVDSQDDVIHKGAFTKTITERGHKIKVLDSHKSGSVTDVVGKCIEVREVPREGLPEQILKEYPEATGALFTKTQFAMNTEKGKQVFELIKGGFINEYSVGIDIHDKDISVKDGKRIRHIRTAKLWEYSPVIWGANPSTITSAVKEMGEEQEENKNTFQEAMVNRVLSYFNNSISQMFQSNTISREQYITGLASLKGLEEAVLSALPEELSGIEYEVYSQEVIPVEKMGQTEVEASSTQTTEPLESLDEARERLRLSITNFTIGEK